MTKGIVQMAVAVHPIYLWNVQWPFSINAASNFLFIRVNYRFQKKNLKVLNRTI